MSHKRGPPDEGGWVRKAAIAWQLQRLSGPRSADTAVPVSEAAAAPTIARFASGANAKVSSGKKRHAKRYRATTPQPTPVRRNAPPERWRLVIPRPGQIAIEYLGLTVDGGVGFLVFEVDPDPRQRALQRGWAAEIVRQLKYAELAHTWERVS
jgi:hypothetical protein